MEEPSTVLSQSQSAQLYTPLLPNSIRLLEIQNGNQQDPISVRLFESPLSQLPTYDAISYVWGDEQSQVVVTCNEFPFRVTCNLQWALSNLRYVDRPRLVWADAICIDQQNLKERSHQISLMRLIYGGARHVFACVGPISRRIAREVMLLVEQNCSTKSLVKIASLKPNNPRWKDARWECLGTLTGMPWFTRAWVLQEVGLARDPRVLFGCEEFSYRDLIAVMRVLPLALAAKHNIRLRLIHMEWAEWSTITFTDGILEADTRKYTFIDLLAHAASSLNCKDPRDRIYAFLGHSLARLPAGHLLIKPDYESDTNSVYWAASVQLLRYEGLRILTKVNSSENSLSGDLPSWVVRWDACTTGNRIHKNLESSFKASAGRTQAGSDSICCEDQILRVRGVRIDRIESSWRVLIAESTNQYSGHESRHCNYEHTESGEILTESAILKYLNEKSTPFTSAYTRSRDRAFLHTITLTTIPTRNSPPTRELIETRKATWCRHRSFFITEEGWYGLGPEITKKGDICAILWGVDVPIILRPCGARFKVLGEAYVRDFMSGEVEDMLGRNSVAERQFEIR